MVGSCLVGPVNKGSQCREESWATPLAVGSVRSLRCYGLRPSGPPTEPLGKDLIALNERQARELNMVRKRRE